MLARLETPFSVGGTEPFAHMSIGVALFPHDGRDGASLLRAADSAMHRAKGMAGASALFFDRSMNGATRARLDAEQTPGRAMAAGEFLLAYQPKFRAGSGLLCGFKALVRWERPGLDRSLIEPLPEPGASAIVRATCVMGHSLQLEIVAEGVETEAQALAAEALGCTHLQGYHLGRPMSAERAGDLLAAALYWSAIASPRRIAPPGCQPGLKLSPPFGNSITTVEPSKKRPISSPCLSVIALSA